MKLILIFLIDSLAGKCGFTLTLTTSKTRDKVFSKGLKRKLLQNHTEILSMKSMYAIVVKKFQLVVRSLAEREREGA